MSECPTPPAVQDVAGNPVSTSTQSTEVGLP